MFRKKNGQEFMDELNADSSVNDKEEKKGFFHRRKKKEINLYEDDMGYIEEDGDFSEEEYDKELDELQEDEKPEKRKILASEERRYTGRSSDRRFSRGTS